MRAVDGEAVKEDMGHEYQPEHQDPLISVLPALRVNFENQPDEYRRQQRQYENGMAETAVIGEIHDRVRIFDKNIQVRESPASGTPQQCLAAHFLS